MSNLNPDQIAAIAHIHSPLLVLAGAGSGKTTVITQKINYLVHECQFNPKKIFAMTFTNKAAKEMLSRVDGKASKISTFHTFGLNFIRKEHKILNFKANISIYDDEDVLNLLQEIEISNVNVDKEQLKTYKYLISAWKQKAIDPTVACQIATNNATMHAAVLYAKYQQHLHNYNAVDFDDLILLPLQLLKSDREIKEKWQNNIHYLLIDEYQDTNIAQYELIKLLVGVRGNITVVGDDHQAVYTWRGANPENLNQLGIDYPNLAIIKLQQNYRSTNTILQAANSLISNNTSCFTKKELWSELGQGELITVFYTKDEQLEADLVSSKVFGYRKYTNSSYSDFAILYRSNHQARIIEKSLREYQIPYTISGGLSFFARKEVKDLIAYLRILVNQDDDGAFLRIANTPKREVGAATLDKLSSYAKLREISLFTASFELGLANLLSEKQLYNLSKFVNFLNLTADNVARGCPHAAILELVNKIDYKTWLLESATSPKTAEKRIENIESFLSWLKKLIEDNSEPNGTKNLSAALNKILLIDLLDRNDNQTADNCVQLLTLHAAKGLEFPFVYIIGFEEEIIPHKNNIANENIEEERRLAYVGITRAKQKLTISICEQRKKFNEIVDCTPSRFLEELPKELINFEGKDDNLSQEERQSMGIKKISSLKQMLAGLGKK
jgi:ATP-dependent DNA helicase Rep